MRYFEAFRDALDPADIGDSKGEEKPLDAGGDCLPFDHLEHRRFEILAYRLKCAELKARMHRVRLMQGTGERGRDIVVYTDAGAPEAIIQCKQYKDRIPAPLVLQELLTLAFYAQLDPSVLGSGPVAYELWCPGGLSEPAARILDAA